MTEPCACGCACDDPRPYVDPEIGAIVQRFVDTLGPLITIRTPDGTWAVPRHYIALHGVTAVDLPALAARFGWARVHSQKEA